MSDKAAGIAVIATALLQYLFLFKLWEGYVLRHSGDFIHPNVVSAGLILSFAGAILIIIYTVFRWNVGTNAARALEHPAEDISFKALQESLEKLIERTELTYIPRLYYTPKNANALEVRDIGFIDIGRVVVGLNLRKFQKDQPETFEAQLGHELSHLEISETYQEIWARRLFTLHFRILLWIIFIFSVNLGFIDALGIGSEEKWFGFVPVFTLSLFTQLIPHAIVIVLSSTIIFVYTKFYIVRREHMHDIRGSMLARSNSLVATVFEPLALRESMLSKSVSFFRLHPSNKSRAKVIAAKDYILLSIFIYPLLIAAIQPLVQMLLAGWSSLLGIEDHWWNLILTLVSAVMLFMLLKADLIRLGLDWALNKFSFFKIICYSLCAVTATQIPRIVMEFLYSSERGLSGIDVVNRIVTGIVSGGGRILLMMTAILLLCSFLSAVRIAATGENASNLLLHIEQICISILVVLSFSLASLTESSWSVSLLNFIGLLSVIYVISIAICTRCSSCRKRRINSIALNSTCICGVDTLKSFRQIKDTSYENMGY